MQTIGERTVTHVPISETAAGRRAPARDYVTVGPVGDAPLMVLKLAHIEALEQVGNTAGIVHMASGNRLRVNWGDYDRVFAAMTRGE